MPNIGISPISIGKSSGNSWSSYWKQQNEVLFFAETKNIADGKLYNQKAGATDYITVTGVGLNAVYETPDTAPYKLADTDNCWWKTDATRSITDGNRLIAYDFTRTIIKYDNASPYVIRAIMILSSDLDTNKMRDDFDLSFWWSGVLSFHGSAKGNRGIGKSTWTAEFVAPAVLLDTDKVVAWFDFAQSSTITKNVSAQVSKADDKSGSGNHMLQSGADNIKPTWDSEGLTFDGIRQFMTSVITGYAQPEFIFLLIKQLSYTLDDFIMDGITSQSGALFQSNVSPKLKLSAGTASSAYPYAPLNEWHILRIRFNGANSFVKFDAQGVNAGSWGTNAMGGITLGRYANNNSGYANFKIKEAVFAKVDLSLTDDEANIYNYLLTKKPA